MAAVALGVRDERAPGPRRLGSGAPRPQARSRGIWRQLGLSAVSPRERSAWLLRAQGKWPFLSQCGGRPLFPDWPSAREDGPMCGEASPPVAGGGQRGKPRSSGPGPGPRPPALHGPGGHTFTSLPVLSPHRACVGPELLSKRCISTKSRRLRVASQRGFLAVPRPPSSGSGRWAGGRWSKVTLPLAAGPAGRECQWA